MAVPSYTYSRTMKCPECGRTFEMPTAEWTYRLIGKNHVRIYCCSYTCWRKMSAQKEKPPRGGKLLK